MFSWKCPVFHLFLKALSKINHCLSLGRAENVQNHCFLVVLMVSWHVQFNSFSCDSLISYKQQEENRYHFNTLAGNIISCITEFIGYIYFLLSPIAAGDGVAKLSATS